MSRANGTLWICPRCGRTFRATSAYHLKRCRGRAVLEPSSAVVRARLASVGCCSIGVEAMPPPPSCVPLLGMWGRR